MDRRTFLKRSTLFAGGVVTATTLQTLAAHSACAECNPDGRGRCKAPMGKGYGALKPVTDQNGDLILALPDGFHYTTFSKTGDAMSDGFATPALHDGMSAFKGPDGTIRLIRNHEIRNAAGDFAFGVAGPAATRYDALASGGCTTIDYDPKHKRIVRDFISINGTLVNCSGGRAYNDVGWITAEETTSGPNHGYGKKHGYNFLVRSDINAPEPAVALTAMGRLAHEAAVADQESGIVFQTEDSGNNRVYGSAGRSGKAVGRRRAADGEDQGCGQLRHAYQPDGGRGPASRVGHHRHSGSGPDHFHHQLLRPRLCQGWCPLEPS
jgi:secreted PhoX family phosphatase